MEKTVYVYANWNTYHKEFDYRLSSYERTDEVLVDTQQVKFETLDDKKLRVAMYQLLVVKKQQVLADAQVEANEIQEQANELLALEDHSNNSKEIL